MISVFVFMTIYIFVNEKEKHDAVRLSEEEKIVEDVAKKHPFIRNEYKDDEDN
jgi:hypothetical protein